jgi:hypothetical protein
MTKPQIPINTQCPRTNFQCASYEPPKGTAFVWSLDLGHWSLIGIWDLDIGHFFTVFHQSSNINSAYNRCE